MTSGVLVREDEPLEEDLSLATEGKNSSYSYKISNKTPKKVCLFI